MSYQALARKWRPKNFSEMVGQETILRMLSNAIDQQRLHHAYLFTGTRGVGKTTLARIIAKCLNCELNVTSQPCGACQTCLSIDAGQFLDLYEVDAASRTKVEDTRELLENVAYAPSQGRYKIYLIDEVHMLSNHSFNALLKTLEEPPAHVKFLLATTEPKKLPITVLSRCLQFNLKRISQPVITKRLQHICETENIAFDLAALEKLADAADGSMRDGLSMLDQAIAYGHGEVTSSDVHNMLGSMNQKDILPLLSALANKDGPQLFAALHVLYESSPDFSQVFAELIQCLHRLAVQQIVPDSSKINESLFTLLAQFTPETIQLYYQMALYGRRDLALTPSPQQCFEMTMLRMLAFTLTPAPTEAIITKPAVAHKTATKQTASTAPRKNESEVETDWRKILTNLNLSGMTQALAANCSLKELSETKIELMISAKHEPMLSPNLKSRINDALNTYFKKNLQLIIITTTDEIATPLKADHSELTTKLSQTKEAISKDPKVKQLIDMYDATVNVSMVT